jgi:hypothetical protein
MNTIFFDWNESEIFEIVLIHFFLIKKTLIICNFMILSTLYSKHTVFKPKWIDELQNLSGVMDLYNYNLTYLIVILEVFFFKPIQNTIIKL